MGQNSMNLRLVLKTMNEKHPRIWQNKEKFRKVVAELFSNDKLYKNLVLISVEESIPDELMLEKAFSNTSIESLYMRLTSACGCSHDLAKEIVDAWIYALGVECNTLKVIQEEIKSFIINRSILIKYIGTEIGATICVPDGISVIAENAFSESPIKEVILPDSVIVIGNRAFQKCEVLQRIKLSNGLLSVGEEAFEGCRFLRRIDIPDSVERIGSRLFWGCYSLKEISMSTKFMQELDRMLLPSPCRVKGSGESEGDFIISGKKLIRYTGSGTDAKIRVPEGIEELADNSFLSSAVAEVILPEGIKEIGKNAFDYCCSLRKIVLPKSLCIINDAAFCHCEELSSLNIPDHVTHIGKYAFSCTALTEITLKPKLIRECYRYHLPSTCKVKSSTPLEGDFYIYRGSLIKFFEKKPNMTVIIPEGVKTIGKDAFYGSNVAEVIFQEGVTKIDSLAFYECKSLKKVVLPNSLRIIGDSAFAECESLTEIDIPDEVKEIKDGVFDNCSSLKRISLSAKLERKLMEKGWWLSPFREYLQVRE